MFGGPSKGRTCTCALSLCSRFTLSARLHRSRAEVSAIGGHFSSDLYGPDLAQFSSGVGCRENRSNPEVENAENGGEGGIRLPGVSATIVESCTLVHSRRQVKELQEISIVSCSFCGIRCRIVFRDKRYHWYQVHCGTGHCSRLETTSLRGCWDMTPSENTPLK